MRYRRILPAVWLGLAAVVICQTRAVALTPLEVEQIATAISVQVNQSDSLSPVQKSGTGIILSQQGNRYTVLTCNHVWGDGSGTPPPVKIRTADGRSYPILGNQSLKGSGSTDLALLTFESSERYSVAKLADSEQAVLGAAIFVYGFPVTRQPARWGENRLPSFSPGYVVDRKAQNPEGYTLRYNAPTLGGMSGGPVLDIDGRVIGVHGNGDPNKGHQSGGAVAFETQPKPEINAAIPISTYLGLQVAPKPEVKLDSHPSSDRPAERLQNPDSALAFDARAQIRQLQGDRQGSSSDFDQAIRLDGKNASSYFHRAEMRAKQGDRPGAIADYSQAIAINPGYANAYFNRAIARNGVGDKAGAIDDFSAALNLDPSDILARYNRGILRRSLRDARGTFEDFDAIVQLAPNRYEPYYNRALAWAMLGNREAAVADFSQALAINPSYTPGYINRALTLRRLGNREGAIADLSYVLSYEPNNATARYNRGLFRRDLSDIQGAFDDLQQAAALFQRAGDNTSYQKAMEVIQRLQSAPVPGANSTSNPTGFPDDYAPIPDGAEGPI